MLKPASFLEALKIELSFEQGQGGFATVQFLFWTTRALSTTEEEEEKNEPVVGIYSKPFANPLWTCFLPL